MLPRRYPEPGDTMAKALTTQSVEKLRADAGRRLEIPDGLLAGLYLVVQPTGKKSWAVRYRADGKPRKLTLGPYPALDLSAAREAAKLALLGAQKGADPAKEKQVARRVAKERGNDDRDSFPSVARLFIERYAKPKNRRWKDSARILGLVPDRTRADDVDSPATFIVSPNSIAARWQDRRIQEIRRRDVLDILDQMMEAGKPIAANRTLATLRKMFAWAASRDIVEASPVAGVKAPATETSRDRVLTDDELRALWIACEAQDWPFGKFVQALILSGQRRDEVAGLRRSEISAGKAMWTIPKQRTKTGKTHDVPLPPALAELFDGQPIISGAAGYVFTTTGRSPISGFSKGKIAIDKRMLETLRKAASDRGEDPAKVALEPWRLHDLRRTVATGMARLSIDLPVIEKVLNHVSGSFAGIVGVYQRHSFADEKRRALDAWAAHVAGLSAPSPKDGAQLESVK